MKFFQKTENWFSSSPCKRIRLSYPDGLSEGAFYVCAQPGRLTEFDSLFCLDINRDASSSFFNGEFGELESYIFQPSNWNELICSFQEVQEFAHLKTQEGSPFSKTTFLVNDWQSLLYLFSNSKHLIGPSPHELLLQLKFLSDKVNVILMSNLSLSLSPPSLQAFGDTNEHDLLLNWAQLSVRMLDRYSLQIEKSAFPDWKKGQNFNLVTGDFSDPEGAKDKAAPFFNETERRMANEDYYEINSSKTLNLSLSPTKGSLNDRLSQILDVEKVVDKMIEEKGRIYDKLIGRLADARSRQELLVVRKEIQSHTPSLSAQEKVALSDAYKVHLQRIKLLEDNFLSSG